MGFLVKTILIFSIVVILTTKESEQQGRPRTNQGSRPSSRADSASSSRSDSSRPGSRAGSSRPGSRCGSRPSSRLSNHDSEDGNNIDIYQSSSCIDHFRLVQSWPKISRNNVRNPKSSLPDNWILHGLWAVDVQGKPVVNCPTNFNVNANYLGGDLISQLREKWPNLCLSGKECGFWIHEFTKHGSCFIGSAEIDTPRRYFEKTMELTSLYNVTEILDDLKFKPKQEPYPFRVLYRNIQNYAGLNHFVRLECDIQDNVYYLAEIHICFDKDFDVVHCVGSGNCYGKEIVYSPNMIKVNRNNEQ
ncbi:hypothetical protein QAD02_006265 [Eretmocerus hayati]|uniref:Uncharacterized protein n=1 Tax=Eretmocerus hayati TaxID=131215 RepID=A0ACC2N0V7_9HYME|nr:hypothetical protein QAD02_006265 [Eretmocerus hayati]